MALVGCRSEFDIVDAGFVDTFVQGGGPMDVDILWVIDDSGTMNEEQALIHGGLQPFVDALLESQLGFHLGVITTSVSDPSSAGVLRGDVPVMTRETPSLLTALEDAADVGISGDRDERGFDAIVEALSESRLSNENAGFRRDDAELAIVVFSDEDDKSVEDPAGMRQWLDDASFGLPYSFSALVGDEPAGCASSTGAADPGSRYIELVEGTEGELESICVDDLAPFMQRLIGRISHQRDTFRLSNIPDPPSIEVEVEGALLWERERDGFQYLPDQNAVRIQGVPLPLPGQEIRVSYDPLRL